MTKYIVSLLVAVAFALPQPHWSTWPPGQGWHSWTHGQIHCLWPTQDGGPCQL